MIGGRGNIRVYFGFVRCVLVKKNIVPKVIIQLTITCSLRCLKSLARVAILKFINSQIHKPPA